MKYTHLVKAIDSTSRHLLGRAATMVNQTLVIRNWLIGAYIVEFEQRGQDRAKYGGRLLESLSSDLKLRGQSGLSISMLERTRRFYNCYPQIGAQIPSSLMTELAVPLPMCRLQIPSSVMTESSRGRTTFPEVARSQQTASFPPLPAEAVLQFSWTQLIELIRLDDPLKRAFYENECLKGNWSVRQLQRQIGSLLYERTVLSRDYFKSRVMAPGDNPPVGIILCSDKDQIKVEFATAGMDNHLFVSRYLVNLPTAEQLSRFLEQDRARFAALLEQQKASKTLPLKRPKRKHRRTKG